MQWLLFLSIGLVPCMLSWQLFRRLRQDGLAAFPALVQSPRLLASLLCAFAGALGALWLFPWAAHLPAAEPWELLPGLGLILLVAVGIRYARRTGSDR